MRLHIVMGIAAMLALAALPARSQPAQPMKPDWITATNQPCKIWNPMPQPNETVTWSGGCKDGLAEGEGVLKWFEDGKPDVEFQGRYANGKRNGHGVIITPDGKRIEGAWVNDEPLSGDRNAI